MTLSQLREYTHLKSDEVYYEIEIHRLEKLKDEKVSYYSSPPLNSAPSGNPGNVTESLALKNIEYGEKIEKQIKELQSQLEACRRKLEAIDEYIESITDEETRSMLKRHIKQRASYNQSAKIFYVSRNYVSRRIRGACDTDR